MLLWMKERVYPAGLGPPDTLTFWCGKVPRSRAPHGSEDARCLPSGQARADSRGPCSAYR
ncbi:hypothetical protein NLX71_09150 [Paenibacillus sp. MZ04-78.2]|uniref:hypothetical protein n=1 Tax=Paenibacillus sp. MZ04-78.2 TaxID=2962034 RepID=UPI0020B88ED4|nr:hypothetical protein [Paenibacillus sp. MZ04-78.2]MCP3773481.1 hypothetical protein [Paenibacillus sp. MZ04-78.2]